MKPTFICEPTTSAERVRQEVERSFAGMSENAGKAIFLDRKLVTPDGVKFAHGFPGVPRVRFYNLEGLATVWTPRSPDSTFVYAISDIDVIVGIECF